MWRERTRQTEHLEASASSHRPQVLDCLAAKATSPCKSNDRLSGRPHVSPSTPKRTNIFVSVRDKQDAVHANSQTAIAINKAHHFVARFVSVITPTPNKPRFAVGLSSDISEVDFAVSGGLCQPASKSCPSQEILTR